MKKNILLLGDYISKPTGVGNILNSIVMNTLNQFNWIQIACGYPEPNDGKMIDMSKDIIAQTGRRDAKLIVYPSADYGNINLMHQVIQEQEIDVVFFMTDPRYYQWLFISMYELKMIYRIPFVYYSVWDNYPIPDFNEPYYKSCDALLAINKLTDHIHIQLTHDTDIVTKYVPHGVDLKTFYKITPERNVDEYDYLMSIKNDLKEKHNCTEFFFWNNTNQYRKCPLLVMEAFNKFVSRYRGPEKVALIMHTDLTSPAGFDLLTVKRALYPDLNIIFSTNKLDQSIINIYYNLAVATINVAYNEGFGLSNLEAIAAGCRTIATKTGGLQDQFFNKTDTKLITPHLEIMSGSPVTPYIIQDHVRADAIAEYMLDCMDYTLPQCMNLYEIPSQITHDQIIEKGMDVNSMVNSIAQTLNNVECLFKNYTITRI